MEQYSLQSLISLRKHLVKHFNADELCTLCFDLGVDYESINGQGREGKARELIKYLERRSLLEELLKQCSLHRPSVAWHLLINARSENQIDSPGRFAIKTDSTSDFQDYVTQVTKNLSVFHAARIFRNKVYVGIRQPGNYVIDIACELNIDEFLFMLIIVECKNWQTAVDTGDVQKIIQTRDAIAAHKAIMASPVGYTPEAIEVAKANGVALWVLANGEITSLAGGGAATLSISWRLSETLEQLILQEMEYNHRYINNIFSKTLNLAPSSWVSSRERSNASWKERFHYSAISPGESSHDPFVLVIIDHLFTQTENKNTISQRVKEWCLNCKTALVKAGLSKLLAEVLLDEVIQLTIHPGFPFGGLEGIDAYDKKVDHSKTKLIAPLDWVELYGFKYMIYTNDDAYPPVHISNNIVWANAAWLLETQGLVQ